jgi:hypothetical protein
VPAPPSASTRRATRASCSSVGREVRCQSERQTGSTVGQQGPTMRPDLAGARFAQWCGLTSTPEKTPDVLHPLLIPRSQVRSLHGPLRMACKCGVLGLRRRQRLGAVGQHPVVDPCQQTREDPCKLERTLDRAKCSYRGGQLHPDAESAFFARCEREVSVVRLSDALDDCQAEADTCVVGSYTCCAAKKWLGKRGN